MSRRVAAIDCGTNSVRLLITDYDADTDSGSVAPHELVRTMQIVRLGQGVDKTGRLHPDALARTARALTDYAALIDEHQVQAVRMVATSATRDAENREDFEQMVHASLGIAPEVVSGQEEAQLSFLGAVAGFTDLAGDVLVTDIGGGSTELVRGRADATPTAAYSMDVGSVRITERWLHDDPPTRGQVMAAVSDIDDALTIAGQTVQLKEPATLIGVAGTVTTIAALTLRLPGYDRDVIHGAVLTAEQIDSITEWLLHADHAQRAAQPTIHPGRVDVITAGAVVLRCVVRACGAQQMRVSEHDILDGIAASLR